MGAIGLVASAIILLGALAFVAWVLLERAWRAAGELIYPKRRMPATTPADYGMDAQPIAFRARDGVALHGWFAPAPPPSKGTVVFSHGYAGDCSPDLKYVPLFNQSGFNVCLFDYRGHGSSEGHFTSLVYFERGDLLCALDYLRTRGIERVGLMGFSMGGAVSLAAAPLSPMVVAVASDSTFAELSQIISNAARERGMPAILASGLGHLVELLAALRLHANLFSADPIRSIGRISPRPVLIMHGTADEAVPVSEAYRLYAAANEPKDLWIVPGANHRMIEQVAGDEYRRRIIDFFDRAFECE